MPLLPAQPQKSPPFVLCLDPGHPSENGIGGKGLGIREVDLVWDLAQRVEHSLRAIYGDQIRIVFTKHRRLESVTNRRRAEIANQAHADLLLRIHADVGGISGFATFYPNRQARIKGVLGPAKALLSKSKQWAETFHASVMKALGHSLPNRGCLSENHTRIGKRQGALTATVFSKVPVFLIEVCAVDNRHDAAFVRTKPGRAKLAQAIVAGLARILNRKD